MDEDDLRPPPISDDYGPPPISPELREEARRAKAILDAGNPPAAPASAESLAEAEARRQEVDRNFELATRGNRQAGTVVEIRSISREADEQFADAIGAEKRYPAPVDLAGNPIQPCKPTPITTRIANLYRSADAAIREFLDDADREWTLPDLVPSLDEAND